MSAHSLPLFMLEFGRYKKSPARMLPEDVQLLSRIQAGDREALGALFVCYARSVRYVAMRILRDRSEAEDLVHDVFLYVLERADQCDPDKSSVRTWLARVTYHRALDRRKMLRRHHFYDAGDSGHTVVPEDLNFDEFVRDAPAEGAMEYLQRDLRRAFDALTKTQQDVLRLSFFDGLTVDEIHARLGKSNDSVRHHYYRGLEQLRQHFIETGERSNRRTLTK